MFGLQEEVSPQAQASLKQGLDEALKANMYVPSLLFSCVFQRNLCRPIFTLKLEATQKEMSEALERSTETILHQVCLTYIF